MQLFANYDYSFLFVFFVGFWWYLKQMLENSQYLIFKYPDKLYQKNKYYPPKIQHIK